jgi:hypothetical protein
MMRVDCDSVILIYYFEGTPAFKTRASARLGALWAAGDILATSDLVRFECRMLPIRLEDAVESGCDRFLTNDARQSAFPGIPVEVLP